mgnify:CR=1 FL=1
MPFGVVGVVWGLGGLKLKNPCGEGGQGGGGFVVGADLEVEGLDKVLFDAEGQFSLQTACNVFIGFE